MNDLLSVDEARHRILSAVRPLPSEVVSADDVLGRVLAEDVVSELDLPPFRSSAMDGYAVIAGDGGELPIIGESRAGHPYEGALRGGEAVRISTGAVVPEGADAVVPVERTTESGELVRVPATEPGGNVREAGEDVHAGDVVLEAGTAIGAAETGMLAALGRETVQCRRRPSVAIVATGDELRPPGEPLAPGQIYDSNAATLSAYAELAGATVASFRGIRDTASATTDALGAALGGDPDVVCVSGGVSVGPHDHVKAALDDLGVEEVFWRVSLKPGKPTWFGTRERRLVFGLPGNPVSAAVTFLLFVRPALRALQGADPGAARSRAVLDAPIRENRDREQAVRCTLRVADDGFHVTPTGPQGSHVLSSMLGAGALALIPAGDGEIAPGTRVAVELL
ncbi:MAG: gephyrin-like molybdotransferase Glp [Thermoleophilaceae bacterium]